VAGAVQREVTEPIYLDIALGPGARFEQLLPAGHNAFVYVYRGEMSIGTTRVGVQRMAILGNEGGEADGVVLDAGDAPVRALLIAGKPLNEPIAQCGPFVMNSNDEILQAVEDFRAGRLA
jgi:redox-sensitive bicupin YhaK (pirin superfamily)